MVFQLLWLFQSERWLISIKQLNTSTKRRSIALLVTTLVYFFLNMAGANELSLRKLLSKVCWTLDVTKNLKLYILYLRFFFLQLYKYRDLTVRDVTNVTSQYKDLKPLMDNYGKRCYASKHILKRKLALTYLGTRYILRYQIRCVYINHRQTLK